MRVKRLVMSTRKPKNQGKTLSQAVNESIAKTVKAGGARVTMTLSPDEAALWRSVLARHPGGQKATFMNALRALNANEDHNILGTSVARALTRAELLAEIERRLK
jgi:hypothetical protein